MPATVGTNAVDDLRHAVENGAPSPHQRNDQSKLPGGQHGDDADNDHQDAKHDGPARSPLDSTKNCFSHSSSMCVWAQADTNRQRCSRTATSRDKALVKIRVNDPKLLCVSG